MCGWKGSCDQCGFARQERGSKAAGRQLQCQWTVAERAVASCGASQTWAGYHFFAPLQQLELCQRKCGRLSTSVISSMAFLCFFCSLLGLPWFTVCYSHQSLVPRDGFCKQALLRPIGRPSPKTNDGDNLPHHACYWLPFRPMDCFTFKG